MLSSSFLLLKIKVITVDNPTFHSTVVRFMWVDVHIKQCGGRQQNWCAASETRPCHLLLCPPDHFRCLVKKSKGDYEWGERAWRQRRRPSWHRTPWPQILHPRPAANSQRLHKWTQVRPRELQSPTELAQMIRHSGNPRVQQRLETLKHPTTYRKAHSSPKGFRFQMLIALRLKLSYL